MLHAQARAQAAQERAGLDRELQAVLARMDAACADKLDGKISDEIWKRKQADWETEGSRIKSRISGQVQIDGENNLLSISRILELAHNAHSLYVTQKPAEQAELLKKVLLNCSIDAVSFYPVYRKPFDLIFKRAKNEEWSGREDLNLRRPGPEAVFSPY